MTINLRIIDFNVVNNSIIPSSNVAYDLGTANNAWRDLFLSGNTISLAGATIGTDAGTGAVTIVPVVTESNPSPKATVFLPTGIAVVDTANGVLSNTAVANASSGDGIVSSGGAGAVELSSNNQGNMLSTLTVTITNYDANNAYIISVTGGSYSRSGASIYWSLPSVSANTVHYLNAQSVVAGTASGFTTANVTVIKVDVADDSIYISDFTGTGKRGWEVV